MAAIKINELKSKSKAELIEQLDDLKKELAALRVKQHSGSNNKNSNNVSQITQVRKSIARVNTIISKTQRDHLRLYYKGKTHIPLDLRPKRTRAIRRRLSKKDASRKTIKQAKKDQHFPIRKYAIAN